MGEVMAATGDRTGSWTGYGDVDVDYYICSDLQGGRMPEVIDAGDPCVMCSHWQGFYGLHDTDRRGFRAFKTVVRRLKERDPHGEKTRWRKCSEITNYACAKQMAELSVTGSKIHLDLPVRVPEFTLKITGATATGVKVGQKPLTQALTRRAFEDGTYFREGDATFVAFTPDGRSVELEVTT